MIYLIVAIILIVVGVAAGAVALRGIFRLVQSVNEDIVQDNHRSKSMMMSVIIWSTILTIAFLWLGIGMIPSVIKKYDDDAYTQREIGRVVHVPGEPPTPPLPTDKDRFDPGVLGDQFGIVNSLFTGLALAGVVIAVLLQSLELKYQRAELANTRKVFMNTYHLQAVQTYMSSLAESTEKTNMSNDLKGSIRSMRESGEVDIFQMEPVWDRTRSYLVEKKMIPLLDEVIQENDNSRKIDRARDAHDRLSDINKSNIGNGLLKRVLASVKAIHVACEAVPSFGVDHEREKAKRDINEACMSLQKDIERIIDSRNSDLTFVADKGYVVTGNIQNATS